MEQARCLTVVFMSPGSSGFPRKSRSSGPSGTTSWEGKWQYYNAWTCIDKWDHTILWHSLLMLEINPYMSNDIWLNDSSFAFIHYHLWSLSQTSALTFHPLVMKWLNLWSLDTSLSCNHPYFIYSLRVVLEFRANRGPQVPQDLLGPQACLWVSE